VVRGLQEKDRGIAGGVKTMITLTATALQAVQRSMSGSGRPSLGLRIRVEDGGCSGLRYGMRLERECDAGDRIVELPGLTVFIDASSAPLLEGVTVDFIDSLDGSGFRFDNPNTAGTCGCGKSFCR